MATIYDLKPKFQNLLRPITRGLAGAGITANAVTIFAAFISVAAGLSLAFFHDEPKVFLAIPVILFVRMALNAIDGMLAREHGMKSALGGILNELTDVISDSALYLPFALISGILPVLIVIIVVLSVISEMTGVVTVAIGGSRRYDGPMGKSDRAFWFGALSLLIGLGVSVGAWTNAVLGLILVLLLKTIVNRAQRGLSEVTR